MKLSKPHATKMIEIWYGFEEYPLNKKDQGLIQSTNLYNKIS